MNVITIHFFRVAGNEGIVRFDFYPADLSPPVNPFARAVIVTSLRDHHIVRIYLQNYHLMTRALQKVTCHNTVIIHRTDRDINRRQIAERKITDQTGKSRASVTILAVRNCFPYIERYISVIMLLGRVRHTLGEIGLLGHDELVYFRFGQHMIRTLDLRHSLGGVNFTGIGGDSIACPICRSGRYLRLCHLQIIADLVIGIHTRHLHTRCIQFRNDPNTTVCIQDIAQFQRIIRYCTLFTDGQIAKAGIAEFKGKGFLTVTGKHIAVDDVTENIGIIESCRIDPIPEPGDIALHRCLVGSLRNDIALAVPGIGNGCQQATGTP